MKNINLRVLSALILLTISTAAVAMEGQVPAQQPAQERPGFLRRNAGRIGLGGLLLGGLGYLIYRNRDRVRNAINNVIRRVTGNSFTLEQAMVLVDQDIASLPDEVSQEDRQQLRRAVGQALVNACAAKGANQLPEEEARQIIADTIQEFAHNYVQRNPTTLPEEQRASNQQAQQQNTHAPAQMQQLPTNTANVENGTTAESIAENPSEQTEQDKIAQHHTEQNEAPVRANQKIGFRTYASCQR